MAFLAFSTVEVILYPFIYANRHPDIPLRVDSEKLFD